MAAILVPDADADFRKRWNIKDGDPVPETLPSPRFEPNHARKIDQARDFGAKAGANRGAADLERARAGQHVASGVGLATGAVNAAAKETLSNGRLLGKVAGEVLDGPLTGVSAGLKYRELKRMGYSDRAALAGAAAATATSQGLVRGGTAAGGLAGGFFGAGAGAVPGAILGGAGGGATDWYFDLSGKAATRAANAIDGRKE